MKGMGFLDCIESETLLNFLGTRLQNFKISSKNWRDYVMAEGENE